VHPADVGLGRGRSERHGRVSSRGHLGLDEALERRIHEVEEHHWWYRGRRRVISAVLGGLDLPKPPEILDAGCGSGRNMVMLAALGSVTGLEISDASVARARGRAMGEVVQASITEMPLADQRFDLAVCLDVLEHIDDEARALRELRRVVRPSGLLLITVPAYESLWSGHDLINQHKRRYNRRTLCDIAVDVGWEPVWISYFNGFLLPVAAAHRRLARLRHAPDKPVSDLDRTPGYLNRALEMPLRLEAWLIAHGWRIPAGLSLIAVLHKPSTPEAACPAVTLPQSIPERRKLRRALR
jgi:SAM-dependent methyltransferase